MTFLSRVLSQHRTASMTDPVAGTLQVTAVSLPPFNATWSNYSVTGVISAPGLPPTAVQQRGMARVAQWPQAGIVLPVTVDRARPSRFVIDWDQVPSSGDRALAGASHLAVQEQTNLDFSVLSDAIDRAGGSPGTPSRAAPEPQAEPGRTAPAPPGAGQAAPWAAPSPQVPPPGAAPAPADVPVPGTVLAVYPVAVPASLAPPGGLWDLSVQAAGRTVLVRASCSTPDDRARIARVGAAVTVTLSGRADVATLVAAGLPEVTG